MPPALTRQLEDVGFTTTPKLALLMRWSEAESLADRGGIDNGLERLAWRGMEMLCQDVLRDLEDVLRVAGVQTSGFVMLPDGDESGAR